MPEQAPLCPVEQWQAWVEHWKPVLGLQAWRIHVSFVRGRELSNYNHTAEIWPNHDHQHAVIKVACDETLDEYLEVVEPMEFRNERTVVHELLHLLYDPGMSDPPNYRSPNAHAEMIYERAINTTAHALVTLRHTGAVAFQKEQRG